MLALERRVPGIVLGHGAGFRALGARPYPTRPWAVRGFPEQQSVSQLRDRRGARRANFRVQETKSLAAQEPEELLPKLRCRNADRGARRTVASRLEEGRRKVTLQHRLRPPDPREALTAGPEHSLRLVPLTLQHGREQVPLPAMGEGERIVRGNEEELGPRAKTDPFRPGETDPKAGERARTARDRDPIEVAPG